MNDIRLDALLAQPARQPEAIPAGLEGHGDPCDGSTAFQGFALPPVQQFQQVLGLGLQFLQGMPRHSRYDAGNQPS